MVAGNAGPQKQSASGPAGRKSGGKSRPPEQRPAIQRFGLLRTTSTEQIVRKAICRLRRFHHIGRGCKLAALSRSGQVWGSCFFFGVRYCVLCAVRCVVQRGRTGTIEQRRTTAPLLLQYRATAYTGSWR